MSKFAKYFYFSSLLALFISAITFCIYFYNSKSGSQYLPQVSLSFIILSYCVICLLYLYSSRGGSTRRARFVVALCLASSAASLYAIYGDLGGKYSDAVTESLYKENSQLVAFLGIFLYYAKDVVSLLFAAVAASCAASAICEKEPLKEDNPKEENLFILYLVCFFAYLLKPKR